MAYLDCLGGLSHTFDLKKNLLTELGKLILSVAAVH